MKELKEFIRFHIQNSKFGVLLANAKEISNPVVEAIEKLIRKVEDKDIDLKEVSEPIVEAQKQTTEAVKAIPRTEIDFTGLEAHIEALKAVLEEKNLEVNIGETKIDLTPVTKAIQKLEKAMPKMEKQVVIDYTALIGEVIQKIEGNKVDLSSLTKCFTGLATSSDLGVLAEWLRVISEKEILLPEFKFDEDGKVLVKVDKVGGGGMGLTSIQEALLQSLSDNQETGLAKESKQLPDNHQVTVSNPTADPETGLAKETKQDTIISNQTDGSQQSQLVSPTGIIAGVDTPTKTLQTINFDHHTIHAGIHFNYADFDKDVAINEIINFVMTTPDTTTRIHLYFSLFSSVGATLELYEGTASTGGTAITPRNNERNSANASVVTLVKDPTITNDGTKAAGYLVGANRNSGVVDRDREYVLKQNTAYLVRITSLANSNGISWEAEWYEN